MGKPHPVELRERAVRLVEQGHTHTEAARRLCVSIKYVNDMVRLRRETGSLAPKRQGNPGRGKPTGVTDWVRRRITAQPDLTIDELTAELAADHGLEAPGRGRPAPHLDRQTPAYHGQASGKTGVHRRNVREDQHGQDHRLGPGRAAPDRACRVR
jgi:transposase